MSYHVISTGQINNHGNQHNQGNLDNTHSSSIVDTSLINNNASSKMTYSRQTQKDLQDKFLSQLIRKTPVPWMTIADGKRLDAMHDLIYMIKSKTLTRDPEEKLSQELQNLQNDKFIIVRLKAAQVLDTMVDHGLITSDPQRKLSQHFLRFLSDDVDNVQEIRSLEGQQIGLLGLLKMIKKDLILDDKDGILTNTFRNCLNDMSSDVQESAGNALSIMADKGLLMLPSQEKLSEFFQEWFGHTNSSIRKSAMFALFRMFDQNLIKSDPFEQLRIVLEKLLQDSDREVCFLAIKITYLYLILFHSQSLFQALLGCIYDVDEAMSPFLMRMIGSLIYNCNYVVNGQKLEECVNHILFKLIASNDEEERKYLIWILKVLIANKLLNPAITKELEQTFCYYLKDPQNDVVVCAAWSLLLLDQEERIPLESYVLSIKIMCQTIFESTRTTFLSNILKLKNVLFHQELSVKLLDVLLNEEQLELIALLQQLIQTAPNELRSSVKTALKTICQSKIKGFNFIAREVANAKFKEIEIAEDLDSLNKISDLPPLTQKDLLERLLSYTKDGFLTPELQFQALTTLIDAKALGKKRSQDIDVFLKTITLINNFTSNPECSSQLCKRIVVALKNSFADDLNASVQQMTLSIFQQLARHRDSQVRAHTVMTLNAILTNKNLEVTIRNAIITTFDVLKEDPLKDIRLLVVSTFGQLFKEHSFKADIRKKAFRSLFDLARDCDLKVRSKVAMTFREILEGHHLNQKGREKTLKQLKDLDAYSLEEKHENNNLDFSISDESENNNSQNSVSKKDIAKQHKLKKKGIAKRTLDEER